MEERYELSLLCTLIAYPEVISEFEISEALFQNPSRRAIAKRVIELERARKPVEMELISRALDDESKEHLLQAVSLTPIADVTHYINELKSLRVKSSFATTLANASSKISGCDDVFALIDELSGELLTLSDSGVSGEIAGSEAIRKSIDESYKGFEIFKSGFEFDECLRIKRGDLIIIGARPSVGKSAFALSLTNGFLRFGYGVAFYSLEMSFSQISLRLVSQNTDIPLDDLESGKAMKHKAKLESYLQDYKSNLFIDDSPIVNIDVLRNRVKRLCRKQKIDIVIIDYLQLMIGKGNNRYEIVSEISRGLKLLAKELNIPIIALSQLNRGLEARDIKKPVLSDLRESGSLEQDADAVLFLSNAKEWGKVVDIAKNRSGAVKSYNMRMDSKTTRFF